MSYDVVTTSGNETLMPQIMESVMMAGDLSKLTPRQRVEYYGHVCESMRLNPLTKPFDYISLNGKLTLYATKNCTDQLRARDSVSIKIANRQALNGVYIVTVTASTPDGRVDESSGAVNIEGLKGEVLANAYMKAETKAKRRATLSICGMGLLDELEAEDTPGARSVNVDMAGQISAGTGTGTVHPDMRPTAKQQEQERKAAAPAPAPPPQEKPQPQPAAAPGEDPEITALKARISSKESLNIEFGKLHLKAVELLGKTAGDSGYYAHLAKHGVQSAKDFKSTGPAKACAVAIFEDLRQIERAMAADKEAAERQAAQEPPPPPPDDVPFGDIG